MKIRKLFSLLLSLCILAGMCVLPHPASAAADASYRIKGEASGDKLVLSVYIKGVLALGGRLALAYDSDALELADTSFLTNSVKQASGVTVTAEGHADSVLVGENYVMFAWYSTRTAGINAMKAEKKVASITFNLLDGVTEEDFSRNTIGLYYVNETMVDGWDCSAKLIANVNGRLAAYRNTAVEEEYLCGIDYDYPRCDYIPIKTYNVSVNVQTADGEPLASTVELSNLESQTDANGHVDYLMPAGTYVYRITSPGYEIKSGYFIINNSDEAFNVKLRSYSQIAKDIADGLKIGFAEGDYADSVTADLILPTENGYGTVSWSSGNEAVSEYGIVRRGEDDIAVTLTATVNVEGAIATRDFDIVVKSRLTAKEKNMAAVSQDKAALAIGYAPGDDEDNVTVNLTLPEIGAKGSSISWISGNDNVISDIGAVKRSEDDTEVTLTAYIIRGTVSDTKTFTVIVKGTGKPAATAPPEAEEPIEPDSDDGYDIDVPESTPEPPVFDEDREYSNEIIQRVINALEIGYDKDDNAESIKNSITLPTVGTEETVIEWTSSLPAVITPYGGVVRQAEDTEVTLVATVSRNDVSAQKNFKLTVKAADTIPQNPNNGQEAEIAVKNSAGGGGSGGGGASGAAGAEVNDDKNEETAPTPTPEPEKNDNDSEEKKDNKKFTDIDSVPWAQNAINTLAERGVINGTGDTTYSPNNNIRRADFVMLLVKLYKLDGDITDTFEDVAEDSYYYSDLSKAKSLGIISGIDETHFNPDGSISRQDMMTMTYRALKQFGKTDNMTEAKLLDFKDADSVSDYAVESVKYLVGGGYIHGDTDGNLNPRSNTTRAETAVFLYGLVQ